MRKSFLRHAPKWVKWLYIPPGMYCYTRIERKDEQSMAWRIETCPFWERTSLTFPDDAMVEEGAVPGYCYYLGKSDLDLRYKVTHATVKGEDGEYHVVEPEDWYEFGLLWDQCKECGCGPGWYD